ncbi:hypothetical protein ACLKA7_012740 [Drosophila subpalustris]
MVFFEAPHVVKKDLALPWGHNWGLEQERRQDVAAQDVQDVAYHRRKHRRNLSASAFSKEHKFEHQHTDSHGVLKMKSMNEIITSSIELHSKKNPI